MFINGSGMIYFVIIYLLGVIGVFLRGRYEKHVKFFMDFADRYRYGDEIDAGRYVDWLQDLCGDFCVCFFFWWMIVIFLIMFYFDERYRQS